MPPVDASEPAGPPGEAPIFSQFASSLKPQSALRAAISAATRRPEAECVPPLAAAARMAPALSGAARTLAESLAAGVREQATSLKPEALVQRLMHEFALSSDEGVALMCVAEALLRIPDAATRDALLRDKLARGDWQSHLGRSESLFVNAAAWGLFLTGKLVATHSEHGLGAALTRALVRHGEPLLRRVVEAAMRLMAEQFVIGETIAEALARASAREARGYLYSFDMLGEAAMTAADAARYLDAYERAIDAIGAAAKGRGIHRAPGISIKLSALHPRYSRAQRARVMDELYPRLFALTLRAQRHDIGMNIDAEESERLELSLDLLERLCREPGLAGWHGIGFVAQAYQKRCPFVIDYLVDLARQTQRRLMVRLVKGAYWDSEIQRAQVDGLAGYPVYTRKVHTDVCYLACARRMLAAPDALYPQFATHNAHTVAAIYHLAGPEYDAGRYEFQCLHGMGEPLYDQVVGRAADGKLARACRVYAPVGNQRTLLPYLVRRLLENGANTSFVNRISDPSVPLREVVTDPVEAVDELARREGAVGLPHPLIPLPRDLFGGRRLNSAGIDLCSEISLSELAAGLTRSLLAPEPASGDEAHAPTTAIRNPGDRADVAGYAREASARAIDDALAAAAAAAPDWQAVAPAERAAALEHAADAMEREMTSLIALAVREAGKNFPSAVAEVREAVDFLRYYAAQARDGFGSGTHRALGPVVCISPWNFPLAIFTGQVSAALAAGNTVLAKPAEQTPLIAARAVRMLHAAGVPRAALHLLPGRGETVGARLVADPRTQAVIFTGSTEVGRVLQRTLAGRVGARGAPVPLIAETGGQNAMIVDSSALAEQTVADALVSAFDSAGQRCSALRILCVQNDIADHLLEMLRGAMAELALGRPDDLAIDVGPVIDDGARAAIDSHIEAMRAKGHRVYQAPAHVRAAALHGSGTFVPPTLIEIDRVAELAHEVFGPVLHVVRFDSAGLGALVGEINALGYGLTHGIQSRIDETIARVAGAARVGNVYVNRNTIGAVVGVQPFGGVGLSGTGPKAGGPLYLYRLLSAYPRTQFARTLEGMGARRCDSASAEDEAAFAALRDFCVAGASPDHRLPAALFEEIAERNCAGLSLALPGPTGESNTYLLSGRGTVLCLAGNALDLLTQLATVVVAGGRAVWQDGELTRALCGSLPERVLARIRVVPAWHAPGVDFDAVLHHGGGPNLLDVMAAVARRPGPIVLVHAYAAGERHLDAEHLLVEKSIALNTAAAGGNATLMAVG